MNAVFSTIDDFSAKGDNEYHRHACDCPVLHNPLLYARCQNLNQSSAISLLRIFNKYSQRRIWSHQRLARKLMRRSQVRLRVLARSCRWTKITPIWLWSDCCGRFSVLPVSCGCSSWLEDLWGSSPLCTLWRPATRTSGFYSPSSSWACWSLAVSSTMQRTGSLTQGSIASHRFG